MTEVALMAEWRRSFRHFRHFRHMSFSCAESIKESARAFLPALDLLTVVRRTSSKHRSHLLSYGVVLYTIANDDELTITHYLLDICVVGGNIIYRRCGLGCELASV